jgi:sulfur carrier protein
MAAFVLPWGCACMVECNPTFSRQYFKAMQLTVNGAPHSFEQNPNLSQLLETLNLTGKRLAVERNGEIVPRSQFADTLLADGDKLEIVVAVGGG